jgi:hypothetical protein
MGGDVVREESTVGVPLRRAFRYAWMDINLLAVGLMMFAIHAHPQLGDARADAKALSFDLLTASTTVSRIQRLTDTRKYASHG